MTAPITRRGLSRAAMAARVAKDMPEVSYLNLGIG
jgi:acyl CoA:acetate/3-ketoacid CoA transferase beta subunit